MGGIRRLAGMVTGLATVVVAYGICSPFQFDTRTRKEIGEREGWACVDCGRKFSEGWMIHVAHDDDKHKPGVLDNDLTAGHCRCVGCHLEQHARMFVGESSGYNRASLEIVVRNAWYQGIRMWRYIERHPGAVQEGRAEVIQRLADYGLVLGHFVNP